MLNEQEAYNMTGEKDYTKASEKIRSVGPKIVIVKLGKEGSYVSSEEFTGKIQAFTVDKIVDTTGAGDAFASGFIVSMLRGYNIRKAVIYANATAALKITRLGSHEIPSHDEVIRFIWDRLSYF